MDVTLIYRGPLPAKRKGVGPAKARIRNHFHPQIAAQFGERIQPDKQHEWVVNVSDSEFIALASKKFHTAARLDVVLYSPALGRPFGDLDNRLKTLVDGLTVPNGSQQLAPHVDDNIRGPLFCLMEDDSLLENLAVTTRGWYQPGLAADETLVTVSAHIVTGPGLAHPTYGGMQITS